MLEPQNYINAQAKYIEQLHALTEDLKKKLVIEQDTSARLRSECSKLQGEIRALVDEDSISAGYAKTINELKTELNSAYTERNRLERFLRSAEKALSEKETELEVLKTNPDAIQFAGLRERNNQLVEANNQLQDAIRSVQTDLNNAKFERDCARKTVKELEDQIRGLHSQKMNLESQLKSAEARSLEKDAELEALRVRICDETNAVNVNLSGIPFKFNFDKKLSPEQEAAFKDTLKETEDALKTLAEGTFLGRLFRQ